MNLESVIGLEIHVQLKTKSKMFCSCANIFGDVAANTAVCPICMGYPGTLPVPNQQAIVWTQRMGAALDCVLATTSKFDRKSYFYPDLPKAYQISQFDQPFCGEGALEVVVNGERVRVGIERIHLEEDAAKNTHPTSTAGQANYTLVDYNRAGTPLMEIVTKPDLRTPAAAKVFLQELQRIVRLLGVSDADMESGHMRCDANISLRPQGTKELHPKTEIKNVNSFRFVEKALTYEIERQTKLWEQDKVPQQQSTRGYDAATNTTVAQRTKEAAADYRYFADPDIPSFVFTADDLQQASSNMPELPLQQRTRLMRQFSLSDQQAQQFVDQPDLGSFFENVASELAEVSQARAGIEDKQLPELTRKAANMILREFSQLITAQQLQLSDWNISAANFAEVVVLVEQGTINKNATPQLLVEMQRKGGDPDAIVATLGLQQVSETGQLADYIDQVMADNPEIVAKIKGGKTAALQFLMGQVMAKSKGTANPEVIIKLLRQKILE